MQIGGSLIIHQFKKTIYLSHFILRIFVESSTGIVIAMEFSMNTPFLTKKYLKFKGKSAFFD